MKKMHSEVRRGFILAAAILVLIFQFLQFIKSQTFILGTSSTSYPNNQLPPGMEATMTLEDAPERNLMTDSCGWDNVMTNPFEASDSQQQQQPPPAGDWQAQPSSDVQEQEEGVDIRSALENLKARLSNQNEKPPSSSSSSQPVPSIRFDPKRFNYRQPAVPTKYTLPSPKLTTTHPPSMVIICFSSRDNFQRRAVIRETWAKGHDNVYFILGGPVPGHYKDMNMENPLSTSSLLFLEQEKFGDIIDTIHPDTYKSLPYKLHFAMRWIMRNIETVDWIVKVDDDCLVRVNLLQFYVLRHMNPNHPMVIGTISVGARPHRSGKWAEDPHFRPNQYPPWAFGSAGYVVSRPVAQFVADNDHYYYQVRAYVQSKT